MSKIIIVDNMQANILPQRSNGILIRPFYGEDSEDKALKYLEVILSKVYYEGLDDIRLALAKYKADVFRYVSSGMYAT